MPVERFHASLARNPDTLFRRTLLRKLVFLAISLGFMVAWNINGDPFYAMVGYGILFYVIVRGLLAARRGIQNANHILSKYARIDDKTSAA